MTDRCFNGTLHSNERNYLDGLWKGLGVDPTDDRVAVIEARLVAATLRNQFHMIQDREREFQAGQKG